MKKILLMLSLLFFTTAGFSEVSDTLVTGGYDKQAMSDAIQHARKETDQFIEIMNKKDADTFAVKAPITDHGRTEHFWLTDVTYSNGMFIGVISNDPGIVTNVEYGQEWKIKKEDISVWMYTRGDKIYGGYTIVPLLVTYPKEEADELRAKLVR
ncbi:TPA: YegJ family protein [Escherichia coli]|nr:YegJ family protein [Escherichia coli]